MSQSTLDDDELFGEAAAEIRDNVEASLGTAYDTLPPVDAVWEIEGDNTLGTLNALKSALDTADAQEHLRDAKKWYMIGQRADAFEDAEDLSAEIETLESLIEDIETAHEQASELASTVPGLKATLEELPSE